MKSFFRLMLLGHESGRPSISKWNMFIGGITFSLVTLYKVVDGSITLEWMTAYSMIMIGYNSVNKYLSTRVEESTKERSPYLDIDERKRE